MGRLRTLLLATAIVAVSVVMAQAGELEIGTRATRAASYHRQHISDSCAFVQGVRGGNPMTVPFFGQGWSNGTTYLSGWQQCTCCAMAEPVISVD